MPDIKQWINLYQSNNHDIKVRAARSLIQHEDVPLWVLLDILDNLSHEGLGAPTEYALCSRSDTELFPEMIVRLNSTENFIREVACKVLGKIGDPKATPHLLRMIDDSHIRVRRAAGFALANLKDQSAITELKRKLAARQHDDPNVIRALQFALQSLGADKNGVAS